MDATVSIPLSDLAVRCAYSLMFLRAGSGYYLVRKGAGSFSKRLTDVSDVRNLASFLAEAGRLLGDSIDRGADLARIAELMVDPITGLAARGFGAARELFGTDLAAVRSDLEAIGLESTVEVTGDEDLVLPWELLFCDDPADIECKSVSDIVKLFWCMRWVIARRKIGQAVSDGVSTKLPVIGLVASSKLKFGREEASRLRSLSETGVIQLREFADDGLTGYRFLDRFRAFVEQEDLGTLHLVCHTEQRGPLDSVLLFGEGQVVPMYQLPPQSRVNAPVVVLNTCYSSARGDTQAFDFVRRFLLLGARCVVAVESKVGSKLASRMGREFTVNVAAGLSAGVALFRARRTVVGQAEAGEDLTGLFYSLHGDSSVRVCGLYQEEE